MDEYKIPSNSFHLLKNSIQYQKMFLQISLISFVIFLFQFHSISSSKLNVKNSLEPILPIQNSPQSPGAIVEENETANGTPKFIPLLRNGQLVNANLNRPKDRTPIEGNNSPQGQQQKAVAAELSGKDGKGRFFRKRFNAILGNSQKNEQEDKLELGTGNAIRDGDTDGTAKRNERAELKEKPVGDELNGKNGKENGLKKEEAKEELKEEAARKSEEFNTFSFLPAFFGKALGIPQEGAKQQNETVKDENRSEEGNKISQENNKIGQNTEKLDINGKTLETKPSGGSVQLAVNSEGNSSGNVICEDLAENCAENRAFCTVSPYEKLMADNCAQTCQKCGNNKGNGTEGSNENVEEKNNDGIIKESDGNQEEEKSTKITKQQEGPECKDISIRCGQWAQRGFCSSRFFHRDLKARFCAKTCSFCGQ